MRFKFSNLNYYSLKALLKIAISLSDGVKIKKFGAPARKALQDRLDPTSESSKMIAEAPDPYMSPIPEISGGITPNSGLDEENSNGGKSRESEDDNSDEEQISRKKARLIMKKLTYSNGEQSPQVLVRDGSTVAYPARIAGHLRVKQVTH